MYKVATRIEIDDGDGEVLVVKKTTQGSDSKCADDELAWSLAGCLVACGPECSARSYVIAKLIMHLCDEGWLHDLNGKTDCGELIDVAYAMVDNRIEHQKQLRASLNRQ